MLAREIEDIGRTARNAVEVVVVLQNFAGSPRLSAVGGLAKQAIRPDRDGALRIEREHVEKRVLQVVALILFAPGSAGVARGENHRVVPDRPALPHVSGARVGDAMTCQVSA